MKIADVPSPTDPRPPSKTYGRILGYVNEHPDEVFRANSGEIAGALGIPQSTVSHALWTLDQNGLIRKARLQRGVWYGSHAAMNALVAAFKAEGVKVVPS